MPTSIVKANPSSTYSTIFIAAAIAIILGNRQAAGRQGSRKAS